MDDSIFDQQFGRAVVDGGEGHLDGIRRAVTTDNVEFTHPIRAARRAFEILAGFFAFTGGVEEIHGPAQCFFNGVAVGSLEGGVDEGDLELRVGEQHDIRRRIDRGEQTLGLGFEPPSTAGVLDYKESAFPIQRDDFQIRDQARAAGTGDADVGERLGMLDDAGEGGTDLFGNGRGEQAGIKQTASRGKTEEPFGLVVDLVNETAGRADELGVIGLGEQLPPPCRRCRGRGRLGGSWGRFGRGEHGGQM